MAAITRLSHRGAIITAIVLFCLFSTYIYRDSRSSVSPTRIKRTTAPQTSVQKKADADELLEALTKGGSGDKALAAVLLKQQEELDRVANLLDRMTRMVELRESSRLEGRVKDSIVRNIDYLHSVDHEDFWAAAPWSVWDHKRMEWSRYVNLTMPKFEDVEDQYKGRGIVFVGGNDATLQQVEVTVSMLRQYGSKLPMELHYLDGELDANQTKALADRGIVARNLGDPENMFPVTKKPGKGGKSFHIKTAAMINSAFREVLYLDSDSMPTRDPNFLFDSVDYKDTGILLWPDFWKTHHTNPIWYIFDTPLVDEWEAESGQVVLDKGRNWDVLLLANYINADGEFYYQLINGDKDSIRFAAKGLNRPYSMTQQFLAAGGYILNDVFCGHTMVQFNPFKQDEVLFVHANLLKEHPRDELNTEHDDKKAFRVFKGYTSTVGNTWLKPKFNTVVGRPCMELDVGKGEPDIREVSFDEAVPGWNAHYKKHGGRGGGQA